MKRTLISQDGGCAKFWKIEARGASITVTFGKIGAKGLTLTKRFANPQQCAEEAAKLIDEKLLTGYEKSEESA